MGPPAAGGPRPSSSSPLLALRDLVPDHARPATGRACSSIPVGVYVLLGLGLNVVVGTTGMLDLGYVAFFAVGAYTTAKLTADNGVLTAWEALVLAVILAMIAGVMLGAPDAAAARRLPRHRHARLRRDRPHHRARTARASARRAASAASRTPRRCPGSSSARSRCPTTTWSLGGDRHRDRAHRPAPPLTRRPVLDRHPRGRGRRRAHGRAHVQDEALVVRHRRVDRRPRRLDLRHRRSASSTPTPSR